MLRSLSKVASSASAAATAAVVSVSTAAAHAEFPLKKFREDAHSRLAKPLPVPSFIDDEYDFCQEETCSTLFGGVPTHEEVEEATRDLQATFVQRVNSVYSDDERECSSPTIRDSDVSSMASGKACFPTNYSPDDYPESEDRESSATLSQQAGSTTESVKSLEREPSSGSTKSCSSLTSRTIQTMTVRGGTQNIVAQCVDLLQRDPDVQAAVVSLAKDPAIWDAFVKNEKVQELLRSKSVKLPFSDGTFKENPRHASKDGGKERDKSIISALVYVKNAVFELMDSLLDLVSNVFGFLDEKIFGAKESDPLDKPLKACMVLTILVLALVVLKRV